jgi:hypothetical protein
VWEPEQGTQSGITEGSSKEETLETDVPGVPEPPGKETMEMNDVPGVPEPPRKETAETEDASGVPQPPTQKGNKMPKTNLTKLLAGHADLLSMIDKILQRSTISWADAVGLL